MTNPMVGPSNMSFNHVPVNPAEWELVYRCCIVRLGRDWNWYENAAHGSAGVLGVTIDADRNLVVETDFDNATEKILFAGANIDHQLTEKGIFVGASGGSSITRYALRSCKDLTGGYAAWTQIRPNGTCFDSNLDNLWIQQVSMRPVT